MTIRAIQKPVGSLEILVHLNRNEKSTITQLIREARLNQRTTYSAISNLENQKLIQHSISNEFPVQKNYRLTKKGKDIAVLLDDVDLLLGGKKWKR